MSSKRSYVHFLFRFVRTFCKMRAQGKAAPVMESLECYLVVMPLRREVVGFREVLLNLFVVLRVQFLRCLVVQNAQLHEADAARHGLFVLPSAQHHRVVVPQYLGYV